jgi:predicted RecA/RadA family phage recombinase
MKNYKQKGDFIKLTAESNISSGDIVSQSGFVGIAANSCDTGELVTLLLDGVFELPTTEAVLVGQDVYLSGSSVSPYAVGQRVGTCIDSGTTSALIRLNSGSVSDYVEVRSKYDLPAPVAGVITLEPKAYFIVGTVDLEGDRVVTSGSTTIFGTSSETSYLTSTGLDSALALITSQYTLAMQFLSISNVAKAIDINGTANPPVALDWTGLNFLNVPTIGKITTCDNFVYTKGAFLNSKGMIFEGVHGTIAFNNSLFSGDGLAGDLIRVSDGTIVNRRFRIIYSAVVSFGDTQGINVENTVNFPNESFILDTVNFSGRSANAVEYLPGVDSDDNRALFVNCTGVINTAVNGQMYMRGNVTATTISNTTDYFKVAGVTIPSDDNSKYTHANNRLTNAAAISRKFKIECILSFNSGNNNVCEFGFFDSKLNAVREPSKTEATANASGRAENVALACVVQHSVGNYIEIWCRNTSAATNITVTSMNVIITEI